MCIDLIFKWPESPCVISKLEKSTPMNYNKHKSEWNTGINKIIKRRNISQSLKDGNGHIIPNVLYMHVWDCIFVYPAKPKGTMNKSDECVFINNIGSFFLKSDCLF